MIPSIGFIIGFYVITRMIQLLSTPKEKSLTRAMALVTILVTAISLADLLSAGMSQGQLPY